MPVDLHAIIENFRSTITQHYFDMKGRVARGRFWYFIVACVAIDVVAVILQTATFLPLAAVINLALLLPLMGMGARRLQDTGRNGQLVWLLAVPTAITQLVALMAMGAGPFGVVGFLAYYFTIGMLLNLIELIAAVALIYFWAQPGDPGPNAYGAPPDHAMPMPAPPV